VPFILTGFRQDMGFRVFAFERRETTRSRVEFTVKADLGLIRRYDIRVQELPLLCRSLLERQDAVEAQQTTSISDPEPGAVNLPERALTFSEDDMRACATDRAAAKTEAARKRKPPRKPTGESPGAAWR
jgi:hypothetical protein